MKSSARSDVSTASEMSVASHSRRRFLNLVGAGVASTALGAVALGSVGTAHAGTRPRVKAIAFDGLAVFDPRPIAALAEQLFPGRGAEITNVWRTHQFEYTWLRTITSSYVDFWQVTDEALTFTAKLLKLELTPEKRARLMHSYLELKAWPDASPVLKHLKALGVSLTLLSDFTFPMLDASVKNSGLDGVFESYLSTDRVQAYKPDPRAYTMGLDQSGLTLDESVFVAFAGWDAAGAKRFGYPTFWANRLGLPAEELCAAADGVGRTFDDLLTFINGRTSEIGRCCSPKNARVHNLGGNCLDTHRPVQSVVD